MKCNDCKVDYPAHLLSARICGICALARKNSIHGSNFTEFGGEIAEEMRQGAIGWRKKLAAAQQEGK